jgi:cytochrome c biogenesis protein CcdA
MEEWIRQTLSAQQVGLAVLPAAFLFGALAYRLALGGGTTACAFGCNPLIPVAMGAAVLQGKTVLGALMLGTFALGYSLPLAAGVIGIGFGVGSLGRIAQRIMPVARVAGGLSLLVVGFYLLKGR